MAKKKEIDPWDIEHPRLVDKISAFKKFVNNNEISNYINNGFYCNKFVYIKDNELSEIPNNKKIIVSNKNFEKILNKDEVEKRFIEEFKKQSYSRLILSKKDFKDLYSELKVYKFEQIKIRNGKFALFNKLGRNKWHVKGYTDALKGFNLDFDYSMLMNIFNFIENSNPLEVKIFSKETYLYITFISVNKVEIFARGVIFEDPKTEQMQLKEGAL